jgi:hypothetical protein
VPALRQGDISFFGVVSIFAILRPLQVKKGEGAKGLSARKLHERFTYGDYLSWHDDERWKLIDGVPSSMFPAPRVAHQRILGPLHFSFSTHLLKLVRDIIT